MQPQPEKHHELRSFRRPALHGNRWSVPPYFQELVTFRGRMSRARYWWAFLKLLCVVMGLAIVWGLVARWRHAGYARAKVRMCRMTEKVGAPHEQEAAPLAARYRAVLAEPVGRRRQMLADTLMLDTVNALAGAKATPRRCGRLS